MSLLDVGKSCAECSTVDFLPFTCPLCSKILCRAHVQAHGCVDDTEDGINSAPAGPSSFRRKTSCEVAKCDRPSIEAIGGKEGDELGEGIAREVRCRGCGGAYCTSYVSCLLTSIHRRPGGGLMAYSHRAQTAHSCTAPLEHNARNDAQEARRARAREIMAQKFPQYKDRVIPKPPPQRDVVKVKTRPPSPLPPTPPLPEQPAPPPEPVVRKTKAEKLREVEIRKIRSLAIPLDPKMRADGERRFFQWSVGSPGAVDIWEKEGKLGGEKKPDRVWVPQVRRVPISALTMTDQQETPIGKLLDIMIIQSKTPRPSPEDPLQVGLLLTQAVKAMNLTVGSSFIACTSTNRGSARSNNSEPTVQHRT